MLMFQRVLIAQAQVLKEERPWAKVACWGEYRTLACSHNEVAMYSEVHLVLYCDSAARTSAQARLCKK